MKKCAAGWVFDRAEGRPLDGSALTDFRRIADYYRREAPTSERKITTAIFEGVSSLADYPWKGRISGVRDTRELVVAGTDYVVTYRVRGEVVEIVRIRHGAQKPLRF